MAKELTRNGVVGLELTREEVIEAALNVEAIMRKAKDEIAKDSQPL